MMLIPIYNTLAEATKAANAMTKEQGRYWTAIHDDRVNGWKITDRYHPKSGG
jgi:hypothetical protein